METIFLNRENLHEWQKIAKECIVALGYFDGLHNGHRTVIETALKKAKEKNIQLAVMSFFPHPKTVLSNGKEEVHQIMPLCEKTEKLKELGVDTFYIVEFDKVFASLLPEQFVSDYLVNLGVVHAVAGFDFSYGHRGSGNMDRLMHDSRGKIEVTKVGKVDFCGEKISSSAIREKLLNGEVDKIPYFLGHVYEVKGIWNGVSLKVHPDYTLPAIGVYEVVLKNETEFIKTKVMVTKDASLVCSIKLPPYRIDSLKIEWHRRIEMEPKVITKQKIII